MNGLSTYLYNIMGIVEKRRHLKYKFFGKKITFTSLLGEKQKGCKNYIIIERVGQHVPNDLISRGSPKCKWATSGHRQNTAPSNLWMSIATVLNEPRSDVDGISLNWIELPIRWIFYLIRVGLYKGIVSIIDYKSRAPTHRW